MIFENLTSWNTEDLRQVLDLALSVANDRGKKIVLRVDTPIVARHYTARKGLVAATFHRETRSCILRLRRPGRVEVEAVDALASIADGGIGRMPRAMVEYIFLAGVALATGRSYRDGWLQFADRIGPPPPELAHLRVRASRTRHRRAPAWLGRQLEAAEREMARIHDRWKSEVGFQQQKIDAIKKKLASAQD